MAVHDALHYHFCMQHMSYFSNNMVQNLGTWNCECFFLKAWIISCDMTAMVERTILYTIRPRLSSHNYSIHTVLIVKLADWAWFKINVLQVNVNRNTRL